MRFLLFSFSLLFILSACTGLPQQAEEKQKPLTLKPSSYSALNGWNDDTLENFASAFEKSCARILKRGSDRSFGPDPRWGTTGQWQTVCNSFARLENKNAENLRRFFEENFTPYSIAAGADKKGLFTGYYEASLRGSKTRQGPYQIPLRARPKDLVMVNLGEFRDDLKGRRIAGRVLNGRLKPYEDHSEIIAGKLPKDQDIPLIWVDDPVDAFFVQIQGSGVVTLDDGSAMRIGYDGQNGHPYYAIGRELIKRRALTKDNVSMQSIRAWLKDNPDQATEVMTTNPSYVFFRALDKQGPVGGEGIAITPLRSLAIDHSLMPYGLPLWVEIDPPAQGTRSLNRLMVAQDTGGAIRGPVRGDVFWGYGKQAEQMAGVMKSEGSYWALLPNSITPTSAK